MRHYPSRYYKQLSAFAVVTAVIIPLVMLLGIPSGVQAKTDCGTWWVHQDDLHVGTMLPEFGFTTCEGGERTTSELQGKPALINFWATWCGPCVKELPHFSKLAREEGTAVQIIGISVDDSARAVRDFLKRRDLGYTITWDSGEIAADLGINSIPVTIAVDSEGRVAAIHHGYASTEELQELLKAAK